MKWGALFAGVLLTTMTLSRAVLALIHPSDPIKDITFLETTSTQKPLVVIVHGFTGDIGTMSDVVMATRQSFPTADILVPEYYASPLANHRADEVSSSIAGLVDKHFDPDQHSRVLMIGNSMGALFARKAYLIALDAHSRETYTLRADDWIWPCAAEINRDNWACATDRFVLMAGLNAGWDRSRSRINRLTAKIAELWGFGRLIRDTEKGAPFVGDLRIDWLNMSNAAVRSVVSGRASFSPPDMIMLKGSNDDVISAADNTDMNASGRDFAFIDIPGTKHVNLVQFGHCDRRAVRKHPHPLTDNDLASLCGSREETSVPMGTYRRDRFTEALVQPLDALDQRYPNSLRLDLAQDANVTHVVYLVHGIRSYGEWIGRFRDAFDAQDDPSLAVKGVRYKRFPMLSFLLFNSRDANVRHFIDQYTEDLARYPNLQKASFIGNSNGTYIMARALEKYHAPTFENVYFSGSVVRYEFPWVTFLERGRVKRFRNDAAASDWVVAWFPGFYQQIASTGWVDDAGFFNLGTGGFNGFAARDSRILEVEYVPGGHGSPIHNAENQATIVAFITEGSMQRPGIRTEPKPNALIQTGANLAWLIVTALGAIAVGLGVLIWRLTVMRGRWAQRGAVLGYAALLIIFLNTY